MATPSQHGEHVTSARDPFPNESPPQPSSLPSATRSDAPASDPVPMAEAIPRNEPPAPSPMAQRRDHTAAAPTISWFTLALVVVMMGALFFGVWQVTRSSREMPEPVRDGTILPGTPAPDGVPGTTPRKVPPETAPPEMAP